MSGEISREKSAAAYWGALAPFIALDQRLAAVAQTSDLWTFAYEFLRFGVKQAWACLFGGLMLGLLLATRYFYPHGAWLARYDFLVVAACLIQFAMLAWRLETPDEAKVILVFHIVGTAMEVFKTSIGSWLYPEPSLLRIGGVPLFTGFMYAAIGSYIARAWRLFDFRFSRHPPLWALLALSAAIYANFFADHYGLDMRWVLFALSVVLFGPCWIHYKIHHKHRRMPLLLGLFLVALFIWFAENIGTFSAAWLYPNQHAGFSPVSVAKLGSWYLLMMISYALVAVVNGVAEPESRTSEAAHPREGAAWTERQSVDRSPP